MSITRVSRGDPISIRADDWNAVADAVNTSNARRAVGDVPLVSTLPHGMVQVRNATGGTRGRFSIMGIDGATIEPHNAFGEFISRTRFNVIDPTADHAGGRYVVLAEPIGAGRVGRAYLWGPVPVAVEMVDEAHLFADCEDGNTEALVSAEAGPVRLVYIQPESDRDVAGVAWCYAILQVTIMGGA